VPIDDRPPRLPGPPCVLVIRRAVPGILRRAVAIRFCLYFFRFSIPLPRGKGTSDKEEENEMSFFEDTYVLRLIYTTHVHHQSITSSNCVDANGWISVGWGKVGARSSGFIYFLGDTCF
jgi:hypothetical protein